MATACDDSNFADSSGVLVVACVDVVSVDRPTVTPETAAAMPRLNPCSNNGKDDGFKAVVCFLQDDNFAKNGDAAAVAVTAPVVFLVVTFGLLLLLLLKIVNGCPICNVDPRGIYGTYKNDDA